MDENEKRRERRKQKRFAILGTNQPVCTCCPETDWRVFEKHHVAGKNFDPLMQLVCMNDHARLSDAQYDHPAPVCDPPHPLERIGHFLLGLADWLSILIEKFREFGALLIEMARSAVANAGSDHASG